MDHQKNENLTISVANDAARLEAAKSADVRLKKERLSESDRTKLARNLGQMFEKCKEGHKELTLHKLFIDAFGETAGKSAHKKRYRHISLSTDSEPLTGLASQGDKYRKLAIELSSYIDLPAKADQTERKYYAILRLIEGSSFDMSTGHRDRYHQAYRNEIDTQLRRLAEKVRSKIDLDWMRTFKRLHNFDTFGRTGVLSEIAPEGWSGTSSTLDLYGRHCDNSLAPCVRLGVVKAQIRIMHYIDIEIGCEDAGKTTEELIRIKLAEKLELSEPINEDNMDKTLVEKIQESVYWKSNDDPRAWPAYYTKRLLDLELRYDEASDRWYPCFLLRFERTDEDLFEPKEYMESFSAGEIFTIFKSYFDDEYCYALEYSKKVYRVFLVWKDHLDKGYCARHNEEIDPDWAISKFRGLYDNDATHPLDERYFDFLLSSQDDYVGGWNFEKALSHGDLEWDRTFFVKAPDSSIASEILKNLAYAPESERLDNLLINDAAIKYQLVKQFAERGLKEYDEAISKF
jgi:hypothetical protein